MKKKGPPPKIQEQLDESDRPTEADIESSPTKDYIKQDGNDTAKLHHNEHGQMNSATSKLSKLKQICLPSINASDIMTKSCQTPQKKSIITRDDHLEALLEDINHKVFTGTKSALKTFREFDLDGDGGVLQSI